MNFVCMPTARQLAFSFSQTASGLSLDDCYVIGDSMNDLPMLDYVQHSILMGNGTPSLRSHVEYVTTDILDDGIENALVHYNLIP